MRQLFITGRVTLRQRTLADKYFWAIINRIAEEKEKLKHTPKELADIDSTLADIYYGNFSVFQSLPDAWAIDQLFPVMPGKPFYSRIKGRHMVAPQQPPQRFGMAPARRPFR